MNVFSFEIIFFCNVTIQLREISDSGNHILTALILFDGNLLNKYDLINSK